MLDPGEEGGALLRVVEWSKSNIPHSPLADAGQALSCELQNYHPLPSLAEFSFLFHSILHFPSLFFLKGLF